MVWLTTGKIDFVSKTDKKNMSIRWLLKDRELKLMTIPAVFHGVMKENISLWMAVYIVDGGQDEVIYEETDSLRIARAFRMWARL